MSIINYAHSFMDDENKIEIGLQLDCSGFTQIVYRKFGYKLKRSAQGQYVQFKDCREQMNTSALLFFGKSRNKITHVAIYIGENKFIHSPGANRKVVTDSLTSVYWSDKLIAVREIGECKN